MKRIGDIVKCEICQKAAQIVGFEGQQTTFKLLDQGAFPFQCSNCNSVVCAGCVQSTGLCPKCDSPSIVPYTVLGTSEITASAQSESKASQNKAEPSLFQTVITGDIPKTKELLENDSSLINSRDEQGCTPLQIAVSKGSIEMVEFLLFQGSNVNAKSYIRSSANPLANTPLHTAVIKNLEGIATILLSKGADANIKNDEMIPLLHIAVTKGNKNIVEQLITYGADIDACDTNGHTALHKAAVNGQIEIAELLINKGADMHARTLDSGAIPLHFAVGKGYEHLVKLFIHKGCDLSCQTDEGLTAIGIATQTGRSDILSLLRDSGAKDFYLGGATGEYLSELAQKGDTVKVHELLNDNPLLLNCRDRSMMTPLHYAVIEGNTDLVELLLSKGALVNARTNQGVTPLHIAAREGHGHIVQLLLRYKAFINTQDDGGEFTPLEYAERAGKNDVAAILKTHGGIRHDSIKRQKESITTVNPSKEGTSCILLLSALILIFFLACTMIIL